MGEGANGIPLWNCFNGCDQEAVLDALRDKGLWPDRKEGSRTSHGEKGDKVTNSPARPGGLDVSTLAASKHLSLALLREWGVGDSHRRGVTRVTIPYLSPGGDTLAIRYRLSLDGGQRFLWRRGDKVHLYGLNKAKAIRERGWVLLVEGESDTWTAWQHDVPALGIPGKSTWRRDWADHLVGLDVYLWQEPDAADLVGRVAADVPGLRVIRAPDGTKDLNDAQVQGWDVVALVEQEKERAVPASELLRIQADRRAAELREEAAPVLEAPDPLALVERAIRASGYGGDIGPPLVCYLASTSRLLTMQHGAMPVHLLLLGPPSSGKTFTWQVILRLLPEEAHHIVDAGSPRVIIYDDAPLAHRVLVYGEADSLPAGEDNPAASAIRNLAQDGELHYNVTIRDPETGDFTSREVRKPGPTVLITTAVKPLGEQMMTRFFILDVPDDAKQVRAALTAQARAEMEGTAPPDGALLAFQGYLQTLVPWKVVVPFADELAQAIGQSRAAPRILRDFARLLSLVKAAAVLRHPHRRRDVRGRLVAEVDDYRLVHGLVAGIYEASVTGVTPRVTNVVTKVRELHDADAERRITYSVVASALDIHRDLARRRAATAIRSGWLVNRETRKGHQADLAPGDPLPERQGLPAPDALCHSVTPVTAGDANTHSNEEEQAEWRL
ncbi:MAG: hypothetical protein HY688_03000 [Chloroflexi bacterium]|nr:hypothetical protein [Chloroflexota bacterium]